MNSVTVRGGGSSEQAARNAMAAIGAMIRNAFIVAAGQYLV
jgi:hypothetical protein